MNYHVMDRVTPKKEGPKSSERGITSGETKYHPREHNHHYFFILFLDQPPTPNTTFIFILIASMSALAMSPPSSTNFRLVRRLSYYLTVCVFCYYSSFGTILRVQGLFVSLPCHRSFVASSRGMIMMSSSTPTSTTSTPSIEEDPLAHFGLPQPLLLGSASFTRKLILKEMNVNFVKLVRPIDEKSLGDRSQDAPKDLVLTLAKAKMDHLVQEIQAGNCQDDLPTTSDNNNNNKNEEWIVLTGDQVVVTCQGHILEKPESIDEAKAFVATYGQSPPSTVGSCVLHHMPSGIQVSGVDTATIYFRPTIATADLIDNLLKDNAPVLSCAGGLMIEHPLVREHIERIDGTEDSVMGLSKALVLRLFQELSEQLK
jgi:septum formation protein